MFEGEGNLNKNEYPSVGNRNFELLTPAQFLHDFTESARIAQQRIWIQSMYMDPGNVANTVIGLLKDGKRNGLDTRLNLDAYSTMVTVDQVNYIPSLRHEMRVARHSLQLQKREMLNDLIGEGIPVTLLNPPKLVERVLPSRGRNHIKIAFVDNVA